MGRTSIATCRIIAVILATGSDYPVLPDYESYQETFAYIERPGRPKSDTDKIPHHNAQNLFGFDH